MGVVSQDSYDSYLAIDRYKRIGALQQLSRDTVEATVWAMSEVEAPLLDSSRLIVRKVLRSNSTLVQEILDLLRTSKGNLVRVHEELTAGGRRYKAQTA